MNNRSRIRPTHPRGTKAIPNSAPWFAGSLRMRDRAVTKLTRNYAAIEMMQLARGLPAICAHINAETACSFPLRMYRSSPTSQVGLRRLGKRAAKMIRDPLAVGAKVAQWASIGGEVMEVTDHPLLDLMTRPNLFQTGTESTYQRLWFQQITGEFYYLTVGQGVVEHLMPMLPQWTNPIPETDPRAGTLIREYAYGIESTEIQPYKAEDVIYLRMRPNPRDPIHGYGPLHDCIQSAKIVQENEDFDLELIRNGGVPVLFISLDPKLYQSPAQIEDAEARYREETSGAQGKARAYFGGGMTVTAPPLNARDMQSAEKLAVHVARVRQAFGIPETVLDNKSSSFASALEGSSQYLAGTIRPMLQRDADQLNEYLLPLFGLEPGDWFFAYDDPMLDDLEQEMRIAESKFRIGLATRAQLAEEINGEPIEQGGDVYYVNGVPLDADGKPEQQAQPPAQFGFLSAPEPEGAKALDADEIAAKVVAMLPKPPEPPKARPVNPGKAACHGPDPYTDCTCCRGEKDLPDTLIPGGGDDTAIRRAYQDLEREVEAGMREAQRVAASQIRAGQAINLSGIAQTIQAAIEPAFRDIWRSGFDLAGSQFGEDPDIDPFEILNTEAVLEAQTSLIRRVSVDITDHAAEAIEARVTAGIEAGESNDEIAAKIQEDTGFSASRAERIARTETSQAQNAGAMERYKAHGVRRARWVNAPGATAVHQAIAALYPDGQVLGEPFIRAGTTITAGGESETYKRDILHPPARPNCRCSLDPVLEDDDED